MARSQSEVRAELDLVKESIFLAEKNPDGSTNTSKAFRAYTELGGKRSSRQFRNYLTRLSKKGALDVKVGPLEGGGRTSIIRFPKKR